MFDKLDITAADLRAGDLVLDVSRKVKESVIYGEHMHVLWDVASVPASSYELATELRVIRERAS